jgi:hypothetical protein
MIKKSFYTAPEAELLVVNFEENIMSPTYNENQHTEYLGSEEDGGNL